VHLYGQISELLADKYKIIHIAYSDVEEKILRNEYAITQVINFRVEIKEIYKNEVVDAKLYNYIDELIITHSNNRFNLNAAFQSDRSFQYLSYNDCLLLSQTYYHFWDTLITSNKVNYLIHEPASLFFNHIASVICKKNNAQYIAQISGYGENKYNFLIVSADNGLSHEIKLNTTCNALTNDEQIRVTNFLSNFRANTGTFLSQLVKNRISLTKHRISFFKLIADSFRISSLAAKDKISLSISRLNQPLDHLEIFLLKFRTFGSEIYKKWSTFFCLKFDEYDPGLKYFYYPIHLEPEAVVLYWGDGIYKNQVKLIENIAAQLPPDCFLYTKEHPHAEPYRDLADYNKMKAIPNVKLINPAVPGKEIIRNSIGVITLNGTSGFEALLLNKQVYMFGNTFYQPCKRVVKIKNIRDLREILYANYKNVYQDDDELYKFVSNYLKSTHNGFPDYFMNSVKLLGIDEKQNAELVAHGITDYIEKCTSTNNNEF
jgi:hypothetical protein